MRFYFWGRGACPGQTLLFVWLHHIATHENWYAVRGGIVSSQRGPCLPVGDGSVCMEYRSTDRPDIMQLCQRCSVRIMTLYDT